MPGNHSFCELKSHGNAWLDDVPVFVCGDDPRIHALKPAPYLFLLAASLLSQEPAGCLMSEDSPAGLQAGLAAGIQVIAVPHAMADRACYTEGTAFVDSLIDITPSRIGF